uniref:Stereocilin LRR domain-containing protein n=1 Tax=Salarias fasciatus TaxID=181472 RepID=A0A672HPT6_SALFA
MRNFMGSLKSLGLFPSKNLASLNKPFDRHRLSGFLYNISLYLQEMGAELEEAPADPDEEQLWEKVLHFFLQSEGNAALNQWNGRVPPRPSVRVQDWFLSLRGSPHWDWLLGLLQSLITISERQPHKPLLSFLSQNWRTVSAVLEAALQALVSGTYGQASAGLQGFICALKGRNDCTFSVSWLQQLLQFLETRNWKPVVSLHPAGEAADHRAHLAQKNLALVVGNSVYGNLRKKVSRVTMALLDDVSIYLFDSEMLLNILTFQPLFGLCTSRGIRHNVMWNTQAMGINSQGLPSSLPSLFCPFSKGDELRSAPSSQRIENGTSNPAVAQMGLDLHATCSDAAWYLSAAEEDFLWVHVCSEFFAHEFNNTVCANSSFWLERAHQLSSELILSPGLSENCLAQLGSRSLSAQAFRHCFLPNNSVLISSLCGRDSPDSQQSLPEGSWAAAYCSKMHNASYDNDAVENCHFREWTVDQFTNSTLLELCRQTHGFREYICLNATLYRHLLRIKPQFADACGDLQAEQEARKCFLQRFFDMLPAPYEFDTSQLCVDPAPMLVEVLHKMSVCEVEGGEREHYLVALGYVLRVLDFMVGLSSGLDEGEREARQGLGQAILLSSLLDNTSWAALQPEASTSVLHTVGVFLRREQNFPRVTPELFVDLSQFIPFMSVSDIMNFPTSLIVNDSV